MKLQYLLPLFLLLALPASGKTIFKVGDVLLQPLDCQTCSMIEAQEETIYSHVGVVISVDPLLIGEALGVVKAVSFEEFNAKTEKGQRVAVLRTKNPWHLKQFKNGKNFLKTFRRHFQGRKYDHFFLWDNRDVDGEEKFYCSELVAKLYKKFLGDVEIPLKRMRFDVHPEFWEKYFQGHVPAGEWGNSPGDYERSPLFEKIADL